MSDRRIDAATLTDFAARIFVACGARTADAHTVAEHLVEANLKGHDSHGVGMIPAYVGNARAGRLAPTAHAEVVRDSGAVLMIDGRFGFGQVVGNEATALAIARARTTGVVCAGLRNAHHLGRIGTYGEQCAAAGLVSIHFVNVVGHAPRVSPWGGREARMTTNPFCCTIPSDSGPPFVLDMATSAIALGKVRVAQMKGERVEDGALVDAEGVPTSDPAVMFNEPIGTLGPFGRHKGYGLAVACELLGGALAGEWTAQPAQPRDNNIVNHMLMFVLDPDAFGNRSAFMREARAMLDYLYSTAPAKGFDRVRIPGDPERESRAARSRDGIPIDANTWEGIAKSASVVGLAAEAVPRLR